MHGQQTGQLAETNPLEEKVDSLIKAFLGVANQPLKMGILYSLNEEFQQPREIRANLSELGIDIPLEKTQPLIDLLERSFVKYEAARKEKIDGIQNYKITDLGEDAKKLLDIAVDWEFGQRDLTRFTFYRLFGETAGRFGHGPYVRYRILAALGSSPQVSLSDLETITGVTVDTLRKNHLRHFKELNLIAGDTKYIKASKAKIRLTREGRYVYAGLIIPLIQRAISIVTQDTAYLPAGRHRDKLGSMYMQYLRDSKMRNRPETLQSYIDLVEFISNSNTAGGCRPREIGHKLGQEYEWRLRILTELGLVERVRNGKPVYYRLAEPLSRTIRMLGDLHSQQRLYRR